MKNGKYQSKKAGMSVRAVALLMALTLLFGGAVGGTIAWLTASTNAVNNTFTVGEVAIKLQETPITWNGDEYTYGSALQDAPVNNQYKMIPGEKYKKDPVVTVTAKSEDCYLFVQFEKGTETDSYIGYTPNWSGWTRLPEADVAGEVYYREVSYSTSDQSFYLLTGEGNGEYKNGYITIKTDVNNDTTSENSSLKYTAYAVQKANMADVAAAWAQVKPAIT